MREEPAISREYGLRQEILAIHPEQRVHDASPRGISVSSAAHTRHGSSTSGSALFRRRNRRSYFAEPFLELYKTAAALACFDLSNQRRLISTKGVDIEVMAGAAESAGTR